MPTEQARYLARLIWDYHHLNHPLQKADCILSLGSHDLRVAERAAELFLEGWAPYIVFSGNLGTLTAGVWTEPEAKLFARVALRLGVPAERIYMEDKATNTGENIRFSRRLLEEKGLAPDRLILVQKPYMERRTFATFMKVWPAKEIVVTSPQISYEAYPNEEISEDDVINIMVGDLQRIRLYPSLGFQIPQEIPPEVWRAYEQLVELGYTHHLVPEQG